MTAAVVKHRWRVAPPPTGPYRSFDRRGWPSAEYPDGAICAHIVCEDEYRPERARTGKHRPLTLRVANHSVRPWQWMRARGQFATLDEAKAALARILATAPSLAPPEHRP